MRSGVRYGRLVAVKPLRDADDTKWVCQCDCGVTLTVYSRQLRSGALKSCGCGPKGRPRMNHGMADTRVYRIWKQMHQRCNNPKAEGYENYGGRGIRVCAEWDDFADFFKDMGDPPTDTTLDRLDTNGMYQKSNCKWSTWREQHRNRRDNHLITAFGKTQCLTAWCEEKNIPVTTLKNRLYRAKMIPEAALSAPLYAKQRASRRRSQ